MLEKLKQLVNEGKLTRNEVMDMAKHFTTAAGDPIEYTWGGLNEYKARLSDKEAGNFLMLMTKAKLHEMMDVHGVIRTQKKPGELELKDILESKGEISLKTAWAKAIRQYSDSRKPR
ncbi:MAG: hypothetical protein QXR53_00500 [Candidatus Norongarragalinales archaeon]